MAFLCMEDPEIIGFLLDHPQYRRDIFPYPLDDGRHEALFSGDEVHRAFCAWSLPHCKTAEEAAALLRCMAALAGNEGDTADVLRFMEPAWQ
jgi:hypothetical protein